MTLTEQDLLGAEVISVDAFNIDHTITEIGGLTFKLKDGRIVTTHMTLWETIALDE